MDITTQTHKLVSAFQLPRAALEVQSVGRSVSMLVTTVLGPHSYPGGLLSTGATLSHFYLLVELGLPLHLFPTTGADNWTRHPDKDLK